MKHLNSYKNFENMESDSMRREICDRCKQPPINSTTIKSMFNQDVLCMGCKDTEKKHPKYKDAHDADNAAIKSGDYNFKGIGKPEDL